MANQGVYYRLEQSVATNIILNSTIDIHQMTVEYYWLAETALANNRQLDIITFIDK